MLHKMKLGTKLIVVLLLIGILPVVGVGYFAYQQSTTAITELVNSKMASYGQQKAAYVHEVIHSTTAAVNVLSATRDVYASLAILESAGWNINDAGWQERETILNNLLPSVMEEFNLTMVSVLDRAGRTVYSTARATIGTDLSQRPYFRTAIQGTTNTSDMFYSDVTNSNIAVVASPIYSNGWTGDALGVVICAIPETFLSGIVVDGLQALGSTADAYLIDREGIIISEPRLGGVKVLETRLTTKAAEALAPAIKSGNSNFSTDLTYRDYRSMEVLSAVTVIDIGGNLVGLVMKVDLSEAFAATNRIRSVLLILAGVLTVVIAVFGTFFGKSITTPIMRAVSGLSEGGQQVASASQQLSSASQQLAAANAQQAAAVQETSSTLEETSSMVLQNTENTRQAAALSAQANTAAEKGNSEMQEMMSSMLELKKSSNQISKIIKVIDEIAFQTNILALNAAVEAARAGEAGMGFAVVAEEVRNLAQRSAQAAKDTASIIEANIDLSQRGVDGAQRVGQALGEVAVNAKKVSQLVDEVAAASQEQSQGIGQINKAIGQVEQSTQQNAASAEESASASEELSAQAITMQEIVQQLVSLVNGANAVQIVMATQSRKVEQKQFNVGPKTLVRPLKSNVKPSDVIPLDDDLKGF